MKPRPIVVAIDTDKGTRRLLRQVLEPRCYRVFEADTGQRGLEAVTRRRPDIVILELDLPDLDGLSVLEGLREWSRAPVLILSRRESEADKVAALDAGANDYLTKPFGSDELLARLRVLQRPIPWVTDGPLLQEGGFSVNLATHEVRINGRRLQLTPTEEALLYLLVRYTGKVVTSTHLIRSLWGPEAQSKTRDLQVYMGSLRKKLEGYGSRARIQTKGSIGYKLLLTNSEADANAEFAPAIGA
jgi:two-component system, OmpR family, KDP operon response regulator KdpE